MASKVYKSGRVRILYHTDPQKGRVEVRTLSRRMPGEPDQFVWREVRGWRPNEALRLLV